MNCLVGFLASLGTLALTTQVLTGIALVLCKGGEEEKEGGHLTADPLDPPMHSQPGRIGLLVLGPVLLFPTVGMLSQAFCCARAYRESCDTRSFVTVFTMVPYGLLQAVAVGTSACLFTQPELIGTHVAACATTVVVFPLLQWALRRLKAQKKQQEMLLHI